jgi:hypothetical protein
MKYIILESKLEQLIDTFLDEQELIIIEHKIELKKYFYFVHSENSKYAQIVCDVWSRRLFLNDNLVGSILGFFNIDEDDAAIHIKNWVEKKLNKKIDIVNVKFSDENSVIGHILLKLPKE